MNTETLSQPTTRKEKIRLFFVRCSDKDRALFQTEKDAIRRAFLILWNNQTADEKLSGTSHLNGKGFNGRDGAFAVSLEENWGKYRGWTNNQYYAIAKMLKKYAGQIDQATE